jgi:hypothetical protein
MRDAVIVALWVGLLASYGSVSGQERSGASSLFEATRPTWEPTLSPWFAAAKPTTPSGNLFASQPNVDPKRSLPRTPVLGQQLHRVPGQSPTVICGMTLIPADPEVDAAMRRTVPNDGTRFTVRTVPPQICRQ